MRALLLIYRLQRSCNKAPGATHCHGAASVLHLWTDCAAPCNVLPVPITCAITNLLRLACICMCASVRHRPAGTEHTSCYTTPVQHHAVELPMTCCLPCCGVCCAAACACFRRTAMGHSCTGPQDPCVCWQLCHAAGRAAFTGV